MVIIAVTTAGRLWGRGLDSFSFHSFGHFCLFLGHPSSSAFKGGACKFFGRGRRQEHEARFGKKCLFLSLCCIYTPFKCKGGVWMLDQGCLHPPFELSLGWFLFPFSPRIGRSNTNFLLGFTMSLSIRKSTATNYVTTDSE